MTTTPALRLCALVAVVVAALVASSVASAKPACADAILAEWLDTDRVQNVYPLPCYQAAIDAIPEDLLVYTNAADVIARAFQRVAGGREEIRIPQGPVEPPDPTAAPDVDTSSTTSVPVPLLVLGGMSLALLGAGGYGYLARRRHDGRDEI